MYMHAYIDDALFIGIMTKTLLKKGLNDGDIIAGKLKYSTGQFEAFL